MSEKWAVVQGSPVAHRVRREPLGGPRPILWRLICNDSGLLPHYITDDDGRLRCKRCEATVASGEQPPRRKP